MRSTFLGVFGESRRRCVMLATGKPVVFWWKITSISCYTLRETNSSPLKIDHWKRRFLLETTMFRGRAVSFREGKSSLRLEIRKPYWFPMKNGGYSPALNWWVYRIPADRGLWTTGRLFSNPKGSQTTVDGSEILRSPVEGTVVEISLFSREFYYIPGDCFRICTNHQRYGRNRKDGLRRTIIPKGHRKKTLKQIAPKKRMGLEARRPFPKVRRYRNFSGDMFKKLQVGKSKQIFRNSNANTAKTWQLFRNTLNYCHPNHLWNRTGVPINGGLQWGTQQEIHGEFLSHPQQSKTVLNPKKCEKRKKLRAKVGSGENNSSPTNNTWQKSHFLCPFLQRGRFFFQQTISTHQRPQRPGLPQVTWKLWVVSEHFRGFSHISISRSPWSNGKIMKPQWSASLQFLLWSASAYPSYYSNYFYY